MPSQHRNPPISIRPPERLREWLLDYAQRNNRPVRSIVTEALEEYRASRDPQPAGGVVQTLSTEVATSTLRRVFTWHFMRPDKPAWEPIHFPGIRYASDGTLTADMKAKGTAYLLSALKSQGYVILFRDDEFGDENNPPNPAAALHHVLWDRWTKEEIGNGRFTGQLFDDDGRIYRGCTAIEAASYTVERLDALDAYLCWEIAAQ